MILNLRDQVTEPILVRGSKDYRASGDLAVGLNLLRSIKLIDQGGVTYCRSFLFWLTVEVTNATAAPITVAGKRLADVVDGLLFRYQGSEDAVDLPNGAGGRLLTALHWLNMDPVPVADLVVPANGSATAKFLLPLPFEFDAFARPQDFQIPISMIKSGALELRWSRSDIFGAGLTITGGSVDCYVSYLEKSELVLPAKFRLSSIKAGTSEYSLPIAGRVLGGLLEVPAVQASSPAAPLLVAANRTSVTLDLDGRKRLKEIDPAVLAARWNFQVEEVARLPAYEAGVPFLPIYDLNEPVRRLTHFPLLREEPILKIGGPLASADLLVFTTHSRSTAGVISDFDRAMPSMAGDMTPESVPAHFSGKTASKRPARAGHSGTMRLPLRYRPTKSGGTRR